MLESCRTHLKNNLRPVSTLTLTLLLLVQLCSCAPVQKTNPALISLSTEIEEANRKLEEVYHRLSVVQFMVDNHERTITDMNKRLQSGMIETAEPSASLTPPVIQPPMDAAKTRDLLRPEPLPVIKETRVAPPADPTQSADYIYTKAFAALKEKKYAKSISLFKSLVSKYPEHNLADNALYWTGEIYYTKQDYPTAIMTFKKIIDQYPKGSKVPDALLKTAYSYNALNDDENTRKYLRKVVVDHPFSSSGSKAEEMLNRMDQ